jgi:type II secretory pathway component PulM
MGKLRQQLDELSDRERKLLIAMAIILPTLVGILVVGIFYRSLNEIEDSTRQYKQALNLVSTVGPSYMERKTTGSKDQGVRAKFTEEVMTDNDIKLTSFIATQAAAVNINVSSYDESEIPIGSKSGDEGPIITERKLKVEIRDAQFATLLKLLERIEASDRPVVIKRVRIQGKPRRPGEVSARIEVSTYVKKEQQS